ncbi:MAG: hypothetical protein V4520_08595 [Bacteroidota bacterium]
MNKILTLYRGDNIDNKRTKPAIYRSEGIVSGAFDGSGPPDMIERLEFLNTVKIHIDHLLEVEKDYYHISDYISFSESEEIAEKWASRSQPEFLNRCYTPYKETRYVFKMQIVMDDLTPLEKGVWEYNFACNPDLKVPYKLNADDEFEPIARAWALRFSGCGICGSVHKKHSLKIINPILYLDGHSKDKKFNRSLRLAKKNLEWIVLPNDIISNGFRASRIQPANFWKVQGYTMSGEPERSPFEVPYERY